MATLALDLGQISQALRIPVSRVETVVDLLDAGNTVPFITRYRKDQTGGLDEEQIRTIQSRVVKLRLLAERKQTIIRSIDSQGKLTPELSAAIEAADTAKRLEDLYLPFKPRKQTLATTARERGLEPLAQEIIAADPAAGDLDARARDFINPDRQVKTAADALLGAGHIIAEVFSERADLRGHLRAIYERTGNLVSTALEPEKDPTKEPKAGEQRPKGVPRQTQLTFGADEGSTVTTEPNSGEQGLTEQASGEHSTTEVASAAEGAPLAAEPQGGGESEPLGGGEPKRATDKQSHLALDLSESGPIDATVLDAPDEPAPAERAPRPKNVPPPAGTPLEAAAASEGEVGAPADSTLGADAHADPAESSHSDAPPAETAQTPSSEAPAIVGGQVAEATQPADQAAAQHRANKEKARQNKRNKERDAAKAKKEAQEKELKAFRDYFQFSESIAKVPPHRVLAINRGERAKALRVKIDVDMAALERAADELLVPPDHPHADFLRGCARDALMRLVLPALEREVRREMTDRAESHAVHVFARNLRNLLLQAPIRGHRVLAVDPGYKSGCKLAALDEFGNLLEPGLVHVIGKEERRNEAKAKLAALVRQHTLSVIAIGNGTACRETEALVADLIAGDLADTGVAYVIVNEAGASVYSTSRLGREEFPKYDATLRGAISIGRRLLDPLSELVKIDPANIGVGMYQHDVKAKHLRESLDAVVESCVNFVGVNLNTASPALLRYVSGLNQLTAQRLYDHRTAIGPFKNREELKNVQGIGETTFVQAAGFIKIDGGDNPLDATWIHPESYQFATQVLERVGTSPDAIADPGHAAALADHVTQLNLTELSADLGVGELTLGDIIQQLTRPGLDPRESLPQPIFKRGILKLDDLAPGMELSGTVLNVVDFGAFVDIGLKESGLVHISQLANRYVQSPHEVIAVGDIAKVWVMDVDKNRRRVSLTMVDPAHRRAPPERRPKPQRTEGAAPPAGGEGRPAQQPRGGRQQQGRGGGAGGRPQGGRPQGGRPQGNRPQGGAGGGDQQRSAPPPPRPKPKKLAPLTKDMQEGKEPLRTFGDLLQFYELKKKKPDGDS